MGLEICKQELELRNIQAAFNQLEITKQEAELEKYRQELELRSTHDLELQTLREENSLLRCDVQSLRHLNRNKLEELLETVTNAQERVRLQLKRVLEDERQCRICLAQDAEVVLNPCGHFILCSGCAGHVNQCPVCRKDIR